MILRPKGGGETSGETEGKKQKEGEKRGQTLQILVTLLTTESERDKGRKVKREGPQPRR